MKIAFKCYNHNCITFSPIFHDENENLHDQFSKFYICYSPIVYMLYYNNNNNDNNKK